MYLGDLSYSYNIEYKKKIIILIIAHELTSKSRQSLTLYYIDNPYFPMTVKCQSIVSFAINNH